MTLIRIGFLAALVALGSASLVSAQSKQVVTRLKNCGSEASNSYGSHKEYPVTDEGNGYVGFQTSDQDSSGTKLRYSLVNCANRKIVRVDASYNLADSSRGVPGGDLFAFVNALRKEKRLANENLFSQQATNAGYSVINGQLAPYGDQRAIRADCGCMTYYADLMPYQFVE